MRRFLGCYRRLACFSRADVLNSLPYLLYLGIGVDGEVSLGLSFKFYVVRMIFLAQCYYSGEMHKRQYVFSCTTWCVWLHILNARAEGRAL